MEQKEALKEALLSLTKRYQDNHKEPMPIEAQRTALRKAGANDALINELLPFEAKKATDNVPHETLGEIAQSVADWLEGIERHIVIIKPHHDRMILDAKMWAAKLKGAL